MSATNDVFGNVREYSTNLDVFGNVFQFSAFEMTPGSNGITVRQSSRVFTIDQGVRVFVARAPVRVISLE